jgi:hypothetical protein
MERSIADGDGKAVLALLKGLGRLPGQPPNVGYEPNPTDLASAAKQKEMFRGMFG